MNSFLPSSGELSNFKRVARVSVLQLNPMEEFLVVTFFVLSAVYPDDILASESQAGHADAIAFLFYF